MANGLDQQFFVIIRLDEVITQSITIEVKILRSGVHHAPRFDCLLGTEIIPTLGVATHDLALAGVGIVDGPQTN